MASEFQEKIRSIGYLSRGRTRNRVREGRAHPESGEPYKTVTDELGHDVTEHGKAGSGVSSRQDVNIHAEPIHLDLRANQ